MLRLQFVLMVLLYGVDLTSVLHANLFAFRVDFVLEFKTIDSRVHLWFVCRTNTSTCLTDLWPIRTCRRAEGPLNLPEFLLSVFEKKLPLNARRAAFRVQYAERARLCGRRRDVTFDNAFL